MVTRKNTRKATVPATPFVETVHPATAAPEAFTFNQRLHKMLDDALGAEQPSWKRLLLAWTMSIATSIGLGYVAGMVIAYAIVGAALLTSSAFVMMLIYVLGMLGAMYLGYKSSMFVYVSIMDKSVDRAYSAASSKVRGWFGSSAIKPVAA